MPVLTSLKDKLAAIPKWRLYLYGGLVVFGAVYLAWCKWGAKPATPGQVIPVSTSPRIASMERKEVTPRRLQVFTPKAEAVRRLQLPADQAADPQEEVFEATEAPPSRYGTETVTFANISTGMPRTVIRVKDAPWFQFERGNTAGVEYGVGTHGRYFQGDYQRDICSVKGVMIKGKVAITSNPSETEWQTAVRAEYRW